MLRNPIPTLLCAAGAAIAQTPPCLSANDSTTLASGAITLFGFAGQNSFAWQITPTSTLVVLAARVFTENTLLSGDRYMAIEIWDDAGGLPGARLAGGSWKIVNSRTDSWQGANLDQFVVLTPAAPVWLVWIEPGFSQPMLEPGGAPSLPHATRSGSGAWNSAGVTAPKFRLFCNYLDDVNSDPFGAGCVLSTGFLPTVYTNEQPAIGNGGFFFETSGNPAGAPVFLVLGNDPTFTSVPVTGLPAGCVQNSDILASVLLFAGTGDTRGPDYSGHALLDFPIPNDLGLAGTFFSVQVAPFDAGATAPLTFGTSHAHRITLF